MNTPQSSAGWNENKWQGGKITVTAVSRMRAEPGAGQERTIGDVEDVITPEWKRLDDELTEGLLPDEAPDDMNQETFPPSDDSDGKED